MPTFKEVQDRINLDYLNRTDFTNETKRAIVRAIKHYERNRFWFNQTATAINASTANTSIALPSDFIALDMVTVTVNAGAPSIVNQRAFERVTYRNASGTSGVPEECAVYNGTLRVYPKPSSAFPVTVYYTMSLPTLSADSDTNDWLSAAEDLVVFHATADLIANVVRGSPQDVATYRDMESVALASLNNARNLRMNTDEDMGTIGPNQRQVPTKTDGGSKT